MLKSRVVVIAAVVALLASACGPLSQASQPGDVIDPVDASKTAVLHVDNLSPSPLELHAIVNGQSRFIGSVSANDSTSLLLDPTILPTGSLYLAAIPADGRGRAVVGPLAVGKGDKIRFTVEHALDQSHAIVVR
jgi:hypothetical protein